MNLHYTPKVRSEWYSYKDEEEVNYFYDLNFLPIAECDVWDARGALGISTQGEYTDKIVLMEDTSDLSRFKVISGYMFEFAQGYKIIKASHIEIYLEDIYRKL